MTPDRETRKKIITEQRKKQILKAAMEVFSNKGYSAATIPDIARCAGLAAGTIYIYYPSKRELFIAVIESLLIDPLSNIFIQATSENFQDILYNVLKDRLHFMGGDFIYRFTSLMGEIQRDPELKNHFSVKILQPFLAKMELFYRIRVNSGEFRQMEPALAVRWIGSLMIGMTVLKTLEGDLSPLKKFPEETLTAELLNFILNGLINRDNKEKTI